MRCGDSVTCTLLLLICLTLGLEWGLTYFYHAHVSRSRCDEPEAPLEGGEDHEVHVVYASDSAYLPGLLSSMLSLSRHVSEPERCTLHVIVPPRDLEQARRVVDCFSLLAQPRVTLHTLVETTYNVSLSSRVHEHHRTQLTFSRLHLPEYLPNVRRALFLDTDTIVQADVSPLLRMRMVHAVAAAPDAALSLHKFAARHLPAISALLGELDAEEYFNPGVLVVDLPRWQAQNLTALIAGFVERASGYMVDMLALNLALKGKVDRLDWRWNVLGFGSPIVPLGCQREARIAHWSSSGLKPWQPERPYPARVHDHIYAPYKAHCDMLR